MKLYLVRGVPGSGKTTYARSLGLPNHFEADMWFESNGGYDHSKIKIAHEWCKAQTLAALKAEQDVVVSNTFIKLWEMDFYQEAANKVDAEVIITKMTGSWPNVHGIPQNVVDAMMLRFED